LKLKWLKDFFEMNDFLAAVRAKEESQKKMAKSLG
jgi:hypothetical protein